MSFEMHIGNGSSHPYFVVNEPLRGVNVPDARKLQSDVRQFLRQNFGKKIEKLDYIYDQEISAFTKVHSLEFYEISSLMKGELVKSGYKARVVENKDISSPVAGWYIRDTKEYTKEEFGDLSIDHDDPVLFPGIFQVLKSHFNGKYCSPPVVLPSPVEVIDPFFEAVKAGDIKLVSEHISKGRNVNETDGAWTPLIWACVKGRPDMVEYLISNKAAIGTRCQKTKHSDITYASLYASSQKTKEHCEALKKLIDMSGSHKAHYLTLTLNFATSSSDPDLLKFLLNSYKDQITQTEFDGIYNSLAHYNTLAQKGGKHAQNYAKSSDCIKVLYEDGIGKSFKLNHKTPLEIASSCSSKITSELILNKMNEEISIKAKLEQSQGQNYIDNPNLDATHLNIDNPLHEENSLNSVSYMDN